MRSLFARITHSLAAVSVAVAASSATDVPQWSFVQNGTTGIIALEMMFVSPTLAIMFDRSANDPLQINGHSAWGGLWDLQTNTASPLNLITDTFCASGAFLSNGSMVSVGGMEVENPNLDPDQDGRMSIRIFEPCASPSGEGCTIFENVTTHHLAANRWYTTAVRIFDGSLLIVGGIHEETPFYNTDPENSVEFFPKKDNGVPRPLLFLNHTLPTNLFPRTFLLPDGKIFLVANNQSAIYDIETNTETMLPPLPNGVRVTNPMDGTATLLPLSPPDFIPEVLVCGGSATDDSIPSANLSSQTPASDQCTRMTITPEGIKKGWVVEKLLEPRIMPEMILLPTGDVVITNGGMTGYAAIGSVGNPVDGASNADHPALRPSLYTPSAPLGQRFSNAMFPNTDIPRMYHSGVSLTPLGNIMLAGSNPNNLIDNTTTFHSEFRVQFLNPPTFNSAKPVLSNAPKKIAFNSEFNINVIIPSGLDTSKIQVALMDLGFSTHAWHSSSRLVFMDATLSNNKKTLTITSPPNNRVFPPGPGFIFVTVDGVTSESVMVMMGTGASPPVPDQGVRI